VLWESESEREREGERRSYVDPPPGMGTEHCTAAMSPCVHTHDLYIYNKKRKGEAKKLNTFLNLSA
jgi:hypothetical protein